MPTAPTPITPYGTPPNSNDPANFDARADAKVAQDVIFVGEANELAENVYDNAVEAMTSATSAASSADDAADMASAAAASAAAAAVNAGAAPWVSGTFYADGTVVWSPLNGATYRRRIGTAGGGVTDPSLDPNWEALSASLSLTYLALMNQGVF